jgi:predicted secreted Zn-dependent protease
MASTRGIRVKAAAGIFILVTCLASAPLTARAEWKAVEKVATYAISGKTGAELYASIGEHGPNVGGGTRAIAYTDFTLTWTRKYEPQDGACVLVSARPKLTITYTLPEPAGQLPAALQESWRLFSAGMRAHEKIHGDIITDMVKQIEAATVGLTVAGDPKCSKIRAEMKTRLSALSLAQRQRSREFDRTEMSGGGNIHQLILKLVNGP